MSNFPPKGVAALLPRLLVLTCTHFILTSLRNTNNQMSQYIGLNYLLYMHKHAYLSYVARCLILGTSLHLRPSFLCESCEGSSKTCVDAD